MANEYILKSFDGGAQTTTLTSGFTAGAGTLTVANGTSFPDGSAGKFVVVVDRGLATEEKFLITSTSGASNVTFTISNAGYDGTSAINHNVGATVDHCLDAYTVEQANRYVNLQTTKGSLVTHTGTTSTALTASATNNLTLLTDSTAGSGIKWAQLPTAGIVDAAVTDAKIATGVALSKLAAGALPTTITVASANIVDATIVDADISGTAAIALSKLATGALPTAITVASANIVDATIVNADVSGSAGITAGKLAGVFTTASGANRAITISTAAPTGGTDGDIWFKY